MALDGSVPADWADEKVNPSKDEDKVTPARRWCRGGRRWQVLRILQTASGDLELGGDVGSRNKAIVTNPDET